MLELFTCGARPKLAGCSGLLAGTIEVKCEIRDSEKVK